MKSIRSNGRLLYTLCEKRHNAVAVMDNKYFITLITMHIAVVAYIVNRVYEITVNEELLNCTIRLMFKGVARTNGLTPPSKDM